MLGLLAVAITTGCVGPQNRPADVRAAQLAAQDLESAVQPQVYEVDRDLRLLPTARGATYPDTLGRLRDALDELALRLGHRQPGPLAQQLTLGPGQGATSPLADPLHAALVAATARLAAGANALPADGAEASAAALAAFDPAVADWHAAVTTLFGAGMEVPPQDVPSSVTR